MKTIKNKKPRNRQAQFTRPLQTVEFNSFDMLNRNTLIDGDKVSFNVNGKKSTYHFTKGQLSLINGVSVFTTLKADPETASACAFGFREFEILGDNMPIISGTNRDAAHALTRLCLMLFAFAESAKAVSILMPNRHWKHTEFTSIAS